MSFWEIANYRNGPAVSKTSLIAQNFRQLEGGDLRVAGRGGISKLAAPPRAALLIPPSLEGSSDGNYFWTLVTVRRQLFGDLPLSFGLGENIDIAVPFG